MTTMTENKPPTKSITGLPYGTPEYGKAWREIHKERLASERKRKYHTSGKSKYLRRRYWINKYKEEKGCERCGYSTHGVAIDFDHIDATTKRFNISHRLPNSTLKRLFEEIRKCRLLCANCHRIKTLEEKQFDPVPKT
jgi:hypothetical protein